jgi:hypothetical protein
MGRPDSGHLFSWVGRGFTPTPDLFAQIQEEGHHVLVPLVRKCPKLPGEPQEVPQRFQPDVRAVQKRCLVPTVSGLHEKFEHVQPGAGFRVRFRHSGLDDGPHDLPTAPAQVGSREGSVSQDEAEQDLGDGHFRVHEQVAGARRAALAAKHLVEGPVKVLKGCDLGPRVSDTPHESLE